MKSRGRNGINLSDMQAFLDKGLHTGTSEKLTKEENGHSSLIDIPIHKLKENPLNPRKFYSDENVQKMADSLAKEGLLVPILVAQIDGVFTVIEGHYRLRGAKAAGIETVRCEVLNDTEVSEIDLFVKGFTSNTIRNTQTVFDDALTFSSLIEKGIFKNQSELAESIQKTKSYVSKVIQVSKLPESAIKVLVEKNPEISASSAYGLFCLYEKNSIPDDEFLRIIDRFAKGEMHLSQLESLYSNKPKKGPQNGLNRNPLTRNGEAIGYITENNTGITVKLKIKDPEMVKRMKSAIDQVLNLDGGEE